MPTSPAPTPRRILGIDPGFGRCGYAVLVQAGGNDLALLCCGCVDTPARTPYPARLAAIYDQLGTLAATYPIDEVAVESLFFGKNVTTVIRVAQARGVVLLACHQHGLPVTEYTPQQIKLAVTGYGSAEKKAVGQMVATILHLAKVPKPDDAADAAAAAICHAQSTWTTYAFHIAPATVDAVTPRP